MSFDLKNILPEHISALKPYSSARNEYKGKNAVFLDANENPFNKPLNRYPDPNQVALKERISELYSVSSQMIFLGNGSDEAIDLLFRAFCVSGIDRVICIDPSYGMYQVSADIQNVAVDMVLLNEDFSLNINSVLKKISSETKLIFLCSPNNPSGNLLDEEKIIKILNSFHGLVVVDEAYIDFAPGKGMLNKLKEYPNLVVLRTFSKAWGLAGIRLGMAFASREIVEILSKIKYPYNLNALTQNYALNILKDSSQKDNWVSELIEERNSLAEKLKEISFIEKIYPSDANFLLIKSAQAKKLYQYLKEKKIIVRNRSGLSLCENCLRITIGSKEENSRLLENIKNYQS